jgi:hypothetical protein
VEQHVIHQVVIQLEPHVHVLGIVRLEVASLEAHVIHKVVMGLEQRVPTHVLLEAPSVVRHATFLKALLLAIHALLEAPSVVRHAHFLHLELHNMDAHMEEHKATVYASCPQDSVYLRDV